MIGLRKIEHDARKDVAERVLKREAKHNGDNAGGRQQAADRHIENVGDDGEAGGNIDDADEEVLQKSRFARLAFEDENRTKEAGKQPGRREPPDNLEDADHHEREVRTLSALARTGKTPAASSMMVNPPKEASWRESAQRGFRERRAASRESRRLERPGKRQGVGKPRDKATNSAVMRSILNSC